MSYRVKFYTEDKLVAITILKEKVDELSYSYIETNLTAGVYYDVVIVAINDQDKGGPSWYEDVNDSDRSLGRHYHELLRRVCIATPLCHPNSIECIENDQFLIMAQATPEQPIFFAATYPSIATAN